MNDAESIFRLALLILIFICAYKGVTNVPQQQVCIVERFGRFYKILEPGLNILIPFVDRIAYSYSLKEETIELSDKVVVTKDGVTLKLNSTVRMKIVDPKMASYSVEDVYYEFVILAQTVTLSEIEKRTMSEISSGRRTLNVDIMKSLNETGLLWGIECTNYEIKDFNQVTVQQQT